MYRIIKPIDREEGYTLAELLIVIALSGIIMYLLAMVYLFGHSYFTNWNNRLKLVNTMHVVTIGLSEDIRLARVVSLTRENRIVLTDKRGNYKEYLFEDGILTANELQVNTAGVRIVELSFRAPEREEEAPHIPGHGQGVEIHIILSLRDDTLAAHTMIFNEYVLSWAEQTNREN
jgi:prepilin-type N-terminal cleavage/methylation domain-containing protein